jgi:hypothetical protein
MMEQHTRVSEAREEAVGRACDHGPSVALANPLLGATKLTEALYYA